MTDTTHDPDAAAEPDPAQEQGTGPPSTETVEFSGHDFTVMVSSDQSGGILFVDEAGVTIRSDADLAALASALREAAGWRAAHTAAGSPSSAGPDQHRSTFDVEPDRIWGESSPADMPKALPDLTTQNGGRNPSRSDEGTVRRRKGPEDVWDDAPRSDKARTQAAPKSRLP
jgi:hypothetical protein